MAESPVEEVLISISTVLSQVLANQKAIHADLVTVNKNVETLAHNVGQQFDDLHGCLRDGIYSEGFDPEAFHRLALDVADIERRTRELKANG